MIKKTIQTNKGITADKWEIVRFEWNRGGKSIVALYGWNEAQEITDEPIDTRVLEFDFPQLLPYGSDLYESVMNTEEFKDATRI